MLISLTGLAGAAWSPPDPTVVILTLEPVFKNSKSFLCPSNWSFRLLLWTRDDAYRRINVVEGLLLVENSILTAFSSLCERLLYMKDEWIKEMDVKVKGPTNASSMIFIVILMLLTLIRRIWKIAEWHHLLWQRALVKIFAPSNICNEKYWLLNMIAIDYPYFTGFWFNNSYDFLRLSQDQIQVLIIGLKV